MAVKSAFLISPPYMLPEDDDEAPAQADPDEGL